MKQAVAARQLTIPSGARAVKPSEIGADRGRLCRPRTQGRVTMSTTILLVRHGETAWNRDKVFRGTFDIPLNDNGRQQARLASTSLAQTPIAAAYTSPLSRASETARIVLEPHGLAATEHDGLLDIDYGDWTGKSDADVASTWPCEHAAWSAEPHAVRIPGGNTLQEVYDRAFRAMEEVAERHAGGTVALFSHRVVNKLLILGAVQLGLSRFPFIIQGNCCINTLERTAAGYLIHCLNDTSHIRSAGAALLTVDF